MVCRRLWPAVQTEGSVAILIQLIGSFLSAHQVMIGPLSLTMTQPPFFSSR